MNLKLTKQHEYLFRLHHSVCQADLRVQSMFGPGTPVGRRLLGSSTSSMNTREHGGGGGSRPQSGNVAGYGGGAAAALPRSVVFDDLMRHYDHYTNYGCENGKTFEPCNL